MFYNAMEANREKAREENYNKLKELIRSQDEDGKINEYYQAYLYMITMENKIESQKKDLDKFRSFFSALFELLPKQFTEKTIIG